jgi:hypothetical protein
MSEPMMIDDGPGALGARRALSGLDRLRMAIVATLFFVAVLLTIGTMVWNLAGVPVRGVAAVVALLTAAAVDPRAAAIALRRQTGLLLLILGVGLLGIVISLLNAMPPADLLQQVMEIFIQSAVFLLLGAIVAEICGGGLVVLLFVAAVGLSALFAVLQFAGVEAAWSLRDAIASFTNEVVRYDRTRAPGLANTAIALATHLTLALAVVLVWRQRVNEAAGAPRKFDPLVLPSVGVFCLVCLASGNRSPIVGAAIFLALYSAIRAPRLFVLVVPFALLSIPLAGLIFESLQETGLRAFVTGDKSSEGRETLMAYGAQLFQDRPIGYGLGFNPTLYWGDHMELLLRMDNPQPALLFELHNYILTMLNCYGIGILLFVLPAMIMIRRHSTSILPFLPYVIHILFHNYGPLAKNDTLVFLALATVTMAMSPGARAAGVRNLRFADVPAPPKSAPI